jgi:DNA (cytosine-5)-methyltransferase 1
LITFGSVCSGIEAASVAWHPMGWRCSWVAEIEPFPSAVLAHRFPDVQNLGDMTTIAERIAAGEVEAPDVLVGGTPCQAFSVAGLRAGLSDSRGQLTLAFVLLANAIDAARAIRGKPPCVILWENVPGVLSDKTNAFGHLLGGLAGEDVALEPPRDEKGRGRPWSNAGAVFGPERAAAWRLLDAQYFRVAQRRRRCFVVASARAGFDPTAVLFDFEGVRRDSAPVRSAWSDTPAGAVGRADVGGAIVERDVTGTLSSRTSAGGGLGTDFQSDGGLVPICMAHGQGGAEIAEDRAPTLTCNHEAPIACYAFQPRIARNGRGDMGDVINALTAQAGETGKGDAAPCVAVAFKASHFTRGKDGAPSEVTPPLSADADKGDQDTLVCAPRAIAFDSRQDPVSSEHVFGALGSGRSQAQAVCIAGDFHMAVRRLTPVECERLQGFPDSWTLVPYNGKPSKDGPRYKALGNSMAVPCMAFLGRRIAAYLNGEPLRGLA